LSGIKSLLLFGEQVTSYYLGFIPLFVLLRPMLHRAPCSLQSGLSGTVCISING